MKKVDQLFVLIVVILAVGFTLAAFPSVALAQSDNSQKERTKEVEDDDDDEDLTDADRREVKLSIADARKIALEKVPGTVIDEELEKERGRLQYAFDIRTSDGKVYDVEISAVTGEIYQAELDDDDDDDAAKSKARADKSQKGFAKAAKPAKLKTRR